jgi:membrane AbrB-like protein
MTDTFVALAVGAVGGLVGRALRIPGGSMLGAMVTVGAMQLTRTTPLQIGSYWAIIGQLLVGAVIGSTLDRRMIRSFRHVLLPGLFAVLTMILSGLLIGVSFAALGFVEPLTALFGMAPGGFAEMTAAAIALGASGPLVASMHLVRTTTVLVLLPLLLRPMARRAAERAADPVEPTTGGTQ